MSDSVQNRISTTSGVSEAEATLRLIASLPVPHGLEDRIQAQLRMSPQRARILAWPAVRTTTWLQSVAAAAIVCVVAGGGWGVYSHVQPGLAARGSMVSHEPGAGQFSTGEARRRPQTVVGPEIQQVAPARAVDAAAKVPAKIVAGKSHGPHSGAPSKAVPASDAVQAK
jgi:hypothetical protein